MSKLKTLVLAGDILEKYGYKVEDFVVIEALAVSDRMNEGYDTEEIKQMVVPVQIARKIVKVLVDFQLSNIQFLDKDDNVLLETVGTGYDDIITPKAFLLD